MITYLEWLGVIALTMFVVFVFTVLGYVAYTTIKETRAGKL